MTMAANTSMPKPRPPSMDETAPPWRFAFILTGFLPLIGLLWRPIAPGALVYSAFMILCFVPFQPVRRAPVFLLATLATGAVIELTAWGGHYAACTASPALFHPQLLADLLLAAGFYTGGGLASLYLFRRFGFGIVEAFVIHGIMGIAIEQQGAVLLSGMVALPASALIWAYVFAIYGCMVAIPRRLAAPRATRVERQWWHYPLALAICAGGTIAGLYGWGLALWADGVLPPHQPICAAPFW